MRRFELIFTAVAFLLPGVVAPALAAQAQQQQQGQQTQERKTKQAERQRKQPPQANRPAPQGQRPPQQRAPQRQSRAQRPQPGPRATQPRRARQRVLPADLGRIWQQHRARDWQTDHRTWRQRGGYTGYRIPQSRFRISFGRSHFFRIYRMPMYLYTGYPCFYYGGYWISLLDPWPQYWPANWYANDDVYIDYFGDGYYLFNPRYPGVRIAVVIYLNLP